ncbi:LacI family DNA-binding transcriptional regulator [Arthrobacter sp. 2MCAF15]
MSIVQGSGRPTLAAVAREAGVSSPTVSKVINGREDVAESTRTKVLAALEQLGYQSTHQRKHAEGRTGIVEVVFDSLYSAYSVEVLNGVLEQAASIDVQVLVDVTGHPAAMTLSPERRAQRILDEGRLGLIVVTSGFSTAQLSAFRRRHIPVVVIDPLNPPPSEVVSVGATNWAGGKEATEHLLGLGHRRIAYVGGPESAECNQARLHGYMAALMADGVQVRPDYVMLDKFRPEHGIRSLKALLALPEPPTAIFAGSDSIGLGVLAEARRHGLRIPEDLSVVGFDGTYQAEQSIPALTTVTQPLQEMGRAALRAVLRLANNEELDSRRVELATHLVVRESTAAPAAGNPEPGTPPH